MTTIPRSVARTMTVIDLDPPPYDPPPMWIRGRAIWAHRSCGDCSDGPPCRCYSGSFMDSLAPGDRMFVEDWLRHRDALKAAAV